MGFLNRLKDKLAPAKGKASELAQQHGDKVDQGLDKAAQLVDRRTKGKYSDKIQTGAGKAKDALDRFAGADDGRKEDGDRKDGGGRTPPGDTPPPSSPTPPTAS
ncbi:antitoxin [Streptomyces sp. p1417]|uniref:Antitoxin n=1 Tax=Streptomyces typhae TaxID=2681492 RepID=A0A6L6X8J7_9ACTN|nr:antitoxin [Streptomyces typhae]MVO89699.1 antitoxin [Streptomyces typhae]